MDKHPLQKDQGALVAELEAAGATVQGTKVKCPWHDDGHASGSLKLGDDGVWRYRCFAGGCEMSDKSHDIFDIEKKRTGRPLGEIIKTHTQDDAEMTITYETVSKDHRKPFESLEAIYGVLKGKHGGKLEALHTYKDEFDTPVQMVIRWRGADGEKHIWPVVQTIAGYELKVSRRLLYRLPQLAALGVVVVVEGELKADILAGYGFKVTTSLGGSQAAEKTDWEPLRGQKVIIWPDYDSAGAKYANEVKAILEVMGCQIKTINPATLDLQEGEDAADYVQQLKRAGYDDAQIKENLLQVFAKAKTTGPGVEVQELITAIGAGKYEPVETGFSTLDDTMQILPGSVNLVCGTPGSSKSLLMLQLAARLFDSKVKTAVFELEKDRCFHLRRALAQRSGMSMITNNRWCKEHKQEAVAAAGEHLEFMDGFGRLIYAMPEKMLYQKDVCEWVQQRADSGCRAVIIDPATRAERMSEPYKADAEFVGRLASIATATRLVIFLVLHPSKAMVTLPDLSMIAGGAAYSRFADNAVWLESHDSKTSRVRFSTGTTDAQHDRTLWILKSRDGSGTGTRIAFQFNSNNLTLQELGRIEKKN